MRPWNCFALRCGEGDGSRTALVANQKSKIKTLKSISKSPGFTIVVVLTLALGIGANTAIFTLIDHVMLRLLPVRNPEELALMPGSYSFSQFQRFRDRNEVFSNIFGVHALPEMELTLGNNAPLYTRGLLVSGSYFDTLGVRPHLGRMLAVSDDRAAESSPVAVISHRFWRRHFDGRLDVIGKMIHVRSAPGYAWTAGLNIYEGAADAKAGAQLTIVGVAPPEFFGESVGVATDVWIPMTMEPAVMPGRPWLDKDNVGWVTLMGRRKPGVEEKTASAAMTLLWRQIQMEDAGAELTPDRRRAIEHLSIQVESGGKGFNQLRWQFSEPLRVLMVVATLVLLIACLNVANLLLARGAARQRELAVKLALGSSRGRLVAQGLLESLLLAAIGGAFGLLLAMLGTKLLVTMVSSGYQTVFLALRPDWRLLLFTAAVSVATVVVFGLAPAVSATHLSLAETLKASSRGSIDRRSGRTSKAFVCVQVAMSVVLLVTAGLFLRSLSSLRNQDVGYDPEHLVMMRLDPVSAGYHDDALGRVCLQVLERIQSLPGVRAATFSENGLFFGTESRSKVDIEEFTPHSEDEQRNYFDQIGPGYFSNVGIPLLYGRDISERDGPKAPRVAVINQTMAKFYFGDVNPVGKYLTSLLKPPTRLEIVGVARDVQDHNFWAKPVRRFYVSFQQPIDGITGASFAIRTTGEVPNLEMALRREVEGVNRNLIVLGIREVAALMDQSLVQERLIARLSAFFGSLALVLAAIGLYGVMAYDVVRRTNEIGIRMALGAQRSAVLVLILRRGLMLTSMGLMAGFVCAATLSRLIESQLHGIGTLDGTTYLAVTIGLIAMALSACWVPARRAIGVDPMKALRDF